ncbi:GH1 family beta-glucosidase [Amycolatopsis jiangsuensis]|uniref:Beta-glucosidase n=1 Tax=Amycolatopsis jiangsuensis TaxID=1181879 RepID=A0A840IR95_9PSEU|nr:GH1 family beta-glucosidase [Amycolatopsis jiangsuensis]MBB4683897.1 beta-glucosidase [Amycolatopsis jiangsuensis]
MTAHPEQVRDQAVLRFPEGFVWGAATAAFQIEGAVSADGRTESVWDAFARRPGAIAGGHTGEPAADHYRRYREDIGLMRDLGLRAYRFSLSWPRIRPDGGAPEPRGLAFYDRLVDGLLDAGIEPWATLYHWDLPQALEEAGGWTARDTAFRFADYAETVLTRLADRVASWSTLNEPWCAAMLGYAGGIHAPGRRDPAAAVAATHHLLLGHGLALEVIRQHAPDVPAGITLNLYPVRPADPAAPADAEACRRIDGLQNRLFLDPVLAGGYPADLLGDLAPFGLASLVRPGDAAAIAAPADWLGVNYYRGYRVSGTPVHGSTPAGPEWLGAPDVHFVPDRSAARTDSGWEVQPAGLTTTLLDVHQGYRAIPLYVTENGAAYPDELVGGAVADHDRTAFLDSHLRAAHEAIGSGVDLRGYFYWSLLDNFEWAEGYAKRFGLVHVDYASQRRTPKQSARWYAEVIERNGLG